MSRGDYMDIVGRATQEAEAEDMESVATRIQLKQMFTECRDWPGMTKCSVT